jgi:hypothetical protein
MAESNDPPTSPPVVSYMSPGVPEHRWKTVWRAADPMEANLAVAELQERGMHARVDFENTAGLGVNAYAPGGTSVQVMEDEVAQARSVLEEIEQRRRRRLDAESVSCPFCNAPRARRVLHPIRKIGLLAAFAGGILKASPPWFGVPSFLPIAIVVAAVAMLLWPMLPYWKCISCGRHFHAPQPSVKEEDEDEEINQAEGPDNEV